uniref:Uncharacterized protein n=1 Tax=Steinernema glaseri TaxID=37863 RepID=A0A1I7XYD0_9BILA
MMAIKVKFSLRVENEPKLERVFYFEDFHLRPAVTGRKTGPVCTVCETLARDNMKRCAAALLRVRASERVEHEHAWNTTGEAIPQNGNLGRKSNLLVEPRWEFFARSRNLWTLHVDKRRQDEHEPLCAATELHRRHGVSLETEAGAPHGARRVHARPDALQRGNGLLERGPAVMAAEFFCVC